MTATELKEILDKHKKWMTGNAVTPQVPAALVRANLPEYCP